MVRRKRSSGNLAASAQAPPSSHHWYSWGRRWCSFCLSGGRRLRIPSASSFGVLPSVSSYGILPRAASLDNLAFSSGRSFFTAFVRRQLDKIDPDTFTWPNIRSFLLHALYFALLVFVSLVASVAVESMARSLAATDSPVHLSKKAQAVLNLVGTGSLEQVRPAVGEGLDTGREKVRLRQALDWRQVPVAEMIPIVFVASHIPNEPDHPAIRVLKQARKTNRDVFLLGPKYHRQFRGLNITVEPKERYYDAINVALEAIGPVKMDVFKWWMLRSFMESHGYERVFFLSVEVMIFANLTEWASWMMPTSAVALPTRWPSMQPPPLPSQYTSTSVSSHIGLWTLPALDDFIKFWTVIINSAHFGGGQPGSKKLGELPEYHENVMLAWYAYSDCWTVENLDPPCMAEPLVGISPKLAVKLRKLFLPSFTVDSLCKPRWCQNTTWSDLGLCVFDNNFAVTSPGQLFKFPRTDKLPSSKLYEYYDAWMGGVRKRTVQFLAVHFHGVRRDYLKLDDQDPSTSWGASPF
eukprot:TRINITY_DN130_c0_g4_i1.p1 TRINITY_DN130_c0_g4~~TRINITY_DN130_c0_g4_i1.p1  ORF type:complete len:522 (+),score=87.39 TRINITY_DN130_c0_g4_i1:1226-2791(+)